MVRPRAALAVFLGAFFALAIAAADSYFGYRLVLDNVDRSGTLLRLLFVSPIGQVPWVFGGGNVATVRHFAFAAGLLLITAVTALICLIGARSAAVGRGGGAVFLSTWIGVVLGSLLDKVAVLLIQQDLVLGDQGGSALNGYFTSGVSSSIYWGLAVGWVPALFAALGFVLANAKARAALRDEQMTLDGEGWPQYTVPAQQTVNGVAPEPGFTYPTSGDFQEENFDQAHAGRNAYDAGAPQRTAAYATAEPTDERRPHADDTNETQQLRQPPPG